MVENVARALSVARSRSAKKQTLVSNKSAKKIPKKAAIVSKKAVMVLDDGGDKRDVGGEAEVGYAGPTMGSLHEKPPTGGTPYIFYLIRSERNDYRDMFSHFPSSAIFNI